MFQRVPVNYDMTVVNAHKMLQKLFEYAMVLKLKL